MDDPILILLITLLWMSWIFIGVQLYTRWLLKKQIATYKEELKDKKQDLKTLSTDGRL